MSYENDKMSTGITWVLKGHGVTLLIAFLLGALGTLSGGIQGLLLVLWIWLGWIFVFQLVYVIPLLIAAKVKKQKETLKGILVAFGVTFLLSGLTCGGSLLLLNGGKMFGR